ncbi:hypothetical protein, partial [Alicyclobacillus sendaiensis]|uniref:hypothetical protein n=1 Tax=Alicyclobacillus sendaiensis TaxID=192387 RepID=UPI0026F40DF1
MREIPKYLVALLLAGVWTVAEEGASSLINFGPITNSWYGLIAPLFVVFMPVLANAFSVPFIYEWIHSGRPTLPNGRRFLLFLRISILTYTLFFYIKFLCSFYEWPPFFIPSMDTMACRSRVVCSHRVWDERPGFPLWIQGKLGPSCFFRRAHTIQ